MALRGREAAGDITEIRESAGDITEIRSLAIAGENSAVGSSGSSWRINVSGMQLPEWTKREDQTLVSRACNLLSEEGLTPEDGNIEANEGVFTIVMGPKHAGRVRTQGFGVTPTRYFPQSKSEEGGGSGSNFGHIASLRDEFRSFRDNQMRELGSFRDEMR
ncbi:hypothetical protein M5K25_015985 [Dendrobium thyrsiflorum]|uniref:Uncharacterized protein n=1 Tax=Dendrobium thyrsiflorum TaxID=117978 RepID=A0ABD0URS4_DENTH